MTRAGFLLFSLSLCGLACAQADELRYTVGNTVFSENRQQLVIHTEPPILVEIQPGGRPWPPVAVDEFNRIYAGAAVIDATSGKRIAVPGPADALVRYPHGVALAADDTGYQFARNGVRCHLPPARLGVGAAKPALASLKDGNIRIATSDQAILALVTQFSGEGTVSGYQVDRIDLAACRVASVSKLGNPDLLVELASSPRGGWWITGSTEQTLLRSSDGKAWRKVKLPRDLSSLISSYAASPTELWLAAMLASDSEATPYMLVYSGNGGKTWRSLKKDDALLAKLPAAWLEGRKRIVLQAAP